MVVVGVLCGSGDEVVELCGGGNEMVELCQRRGWWFFATSSSLGVAGLCCVCSFVCVVFKLVLAIYFLMPYVVVVFFLNVARKGLVCRRSVMAVVVIHVPFRIFGSFWVVLVGSCCFLI